MSLFSFLFPKKHKSHEAIKLLTPTEFRKHVDGKNVQLIDVRTPSEFASGHIKGAKNIDFFSGRFNVEFNKLDKTKPVYVYCRSGNRSRQTSKKMAVNGFSEIYDLKGGIVNY